MEWTSSQVFHKHLHLVLTTAFWGSHFIPQLGKQAVRDVTRCPSFNSKHPQWNSRESVLSSPCFYHISSCFGRMVALVAFIITKPSSSAWNTKHEQNLDGKEEKSKPEWKRQTGPWLQQATVFIKSLEIDLEINIITLFCCMDLFLHLLHCKPNKVQCFHILSQFFHLLSL